MVDVGIVFLRLKALEDSFSFLILNNLADVPGNS
jgi:hypothetical protein